METLKNITAAIIELTLKEIKTVTLNNGIIVSIQLADKTEINNICNYTEIYEKLLSIKSLKAFYHLDIIEAVNDNEFDQYVYNYNIIHINEFDQYVYNYNIIHINGWGQRFKGTIKVNYLIQSEEKEITKDDTSYHQNNLELNITVNNEEEIININDITEFKTNGSEYINISTVDGDYTIEKDIDHYTINKIIDLLDKHKIQYLIEYENYESGEVFKDIPTESDGDNWQCFERIVTIYQ